MERQTKRHWRWLLLLVVVLVGAAGLAAAGQVSAEAGMITGVVTRPDGGLPPAGTVVRLLSADGQQHGQATVEPATGLFSLGPVANGNYILQAWPPEGSPYTPSLPKFLMVVHEPQNVGVLALTEPSILGTVYAPDEVTPVGAMVRVYHNDHLVQNSPALNGEIQIGGLLTGTYTLQAEPVVNEPYWLSARRLVTVTLGVSQTVDLVLRPANVAGRILSPQGIPVWGAVAHVVGVNLHTHHSDQSSVTGYFAIGDLAADTYVLHVEPPWYADGMASPPPITFTVPPAFTYLDDITLVTAPKVVEGTVKTNTNIPVENARVIANRLDHPGHQEELTGPNGHYLLHLSSGLWSITVEPTDSSDPGQWLYPHPPRLVHFEHNLEPEVKIVHFEVVTADSHVTGIVKLPGGGTPPFTVTVGLRNNEGIGRSQVVDPADGSFDIQVPHGNYVLAVIPHDPQYAGPPPQAVYAPESDTLDVGVLTLVERDATISGMVTDGTGQGVGGVRVVGWTREHQGAQAVTSEDGSYLLAVMAGDWLVRPEVPPTLPYIYDGGPISVTIAAMQHLTGMDFGLTEANNVVAGQLVDGEGNSVYAQGWAGAADGDNRVNGAPVEGGSFAIYLPDGDYQIGVHLAPGSEWLAGPAQPVSVAGGETVTISVPLLPQDADIFAALWDPRREIVPVGVEGFVMADNPFAWVGDAINPANGTAHLPVSAGLWHLSYQVAPDSGYVVLDHHKVVPIESGQTLGVKLPVAERDSLLRGVVLDPAGNPLAGVVVAADGLGHEIGQVTLRSHSGDDGTFRLAVPHGVYQLRAAGGDPDWLNPVLQAVEAPAGGVVNGLVLQFRETDVTLSGATSIAGDPPINGRVHIWAYSNDGAASQTTVMLGESYSLGLLSNQRWHVGAVLETGDSFYVVRTAVLMGSSDQVLDLVLAGPFAKPGPVVVTFDPTQPQQVALSDGTSIFIPAGAMPVSGTVTLHITPIATLPHQHHARLYKYGYAFIALDETGTPITDNFNQNVIITFAYEEAELEVLNLNEDHLKPAYYSTTTASWTVPDGYVVDTAANQVTMQIDHFTDFSLMGSGVVEVFLPVAVR